MAIRTCIHRPSRYWGHVNPIGPRSVYDEAKRFSEALTMAYHRYRGVDTRIVRIFNTYGPRLQLDDGRVISNFMKQALLGDDITIYGDGSQTRSFCYVSDEVDGIVRLAASGEHLPTNIGNPGEFTMLECAKIVLEVTGSASKLVFAAASAGRSQAALSRYFQGKSPARMGAYDRSADRVAAESRLLPRESCGREPGFQDRLLTLARAASSAAWASRPHRPFVPSIRCHSPMPRRNAIIEAV